MRELQTALGLVAAQAGMTLVPAGVRQLRRDGVAFRDLDEDDASAEIGVILGLIRDIYREGGIVLGE